MPTATRASHLSIAAVLAATLLLPVASAGEPLLLGHAGGCIEIGKLSNNQIIASQGKVKDHGTHND